VNIRNTTNLTGETLIRNCAKVRRIYASKLKFPGAHVMARRQQSKRRAHRLTANESDLLYYRSHIREACQNDHVMCLECGLTFKSLPQHLGKHHLTNDEYKARWGYNRTTPLVAGITSRGLRRRALAMNLAAYSPPHALRKALKARRGRRSPYRPEQRLAQIDAARNRIAVGLRLPRPKKKNIIRRARAVLITKSKITDDDRRILLLREKGLWASEIAAVLDLKVSSIHDRFDRLRKIGLSIPPASGLRPNANRKVSAEEIIALARSRLTVQEIAAKVGISKKNVHARLRVLRTES
jgi:predicted transcriptional regulator/DNA-directed RNA polymerase specialized sigma24 family protein